MFSYIGVTLDYTLKAVCQTAFCGTWIDDLENVYLWETPFYTMIGIER